uniref:Uncharacterized protein n=1 Tax=Pseudonaja textilis TaxID=8673 RepID=A0A670Z1W3_PSETE
MQRIASGFFSIYRHGYRSPIENYPNGLHSESEWPQGFGQLTKIGMQQQYELGQCIKKRCSDFLNVSYKREEPTLFLFTPCQGLLRYAFLLINLRLFFSVV